MTDPFRLIYTSRNLLGDEGDALELTVARIVEVSRRNNDRAGITGALFFSAALFVQVLEGPRAAVEGTFERIQRDLRHRDIHVLQCETVAERLFPSWSMAFVGRSARGRALWDGLARSTGFDLGRVEGDSFCAALLAMVRAEEEGGAAAPGTRGAGLDVERLRSALDAEQPGRRTATAVGGRTESPKPAPSLLAPSPTPPPSTGPGRDAGDGVLRAALDEERERTTALRRELDEARIALKRAEGGSEGLERQRDIWADRSSQLRASLKAARDGLAEAEAERDGLQERVASYDAEATVLRAHRDVWAERARALASALCLDPVIDGRVDEPVMFDRSAREHRGAPLTVVAS